jgi:hypothetical protein
MRVMYEAYAGHYRARMLVTLQVGARSETFPQQIGAPSGDRATSALLRPLW